MSAGSGKGPLPEGRLLMSLCGKGVRELSGELCRVSFMEVPIPFMELHLKGSTS